MKNLSGAPTEYLKDVELNVAVRAAWMHYAGGLTQSEVAKRLGLSSVKAHRLISKANELGLVRIYVDGDVSECVRLETILLERYNLDLCQVVPDLQEGDLPHRALGIAGANFLRTRIESNDYEIIGIGHGRTLASVIDYLPRLDAKGTRFVSLLGGLTANFAANPHDVIHRLAYRTSGEAYVMPVPFFANSPEDREILRQQHGISKIIDLAKNADLQIVGIGTTEPMASMVADGMIKKEEIAEVKAMGGIAELLGHFFDADGQFIESALSSRNMALDIKTFSQVNMVAIAGGLTKVEAIQSILKSGLLNGLIIDEVTAAALILI